MINGLLFMIFWKTLTKIQKYDFCGSDCWIDKFVKAFCIFFSGKRLSAHDSEFIANLETKIEQKDLTPNLLYIANTNWKLATVANQNLCNMQRS